MKDIEGLEDIKIFVDEFYGRVQLDTLIGPVFNRVVEDWPHHLEKLYAFWNAALFGVPGFKGNPFAKHAPLDIGPHHFKRWVQLFHETIDHYFTGVVAADAKKRAEIMAQLFISRLASLGGDTGKVVY